MHTRRNGDADGQRRAAALTCPTAGATTADDMAAVLVFLVALVHTGRSCQHASAAAERGRRLHHQAERRRACVWSRDVLAI